MNHELIHFIVIVFSLYDVTVKCTTHCGSTKNVVVFSFKFLMYYQKRECELLFLETQGSVEWINICTKI
jgi:hypothetical protein